MTAKKAELVLLKIGDGTAPSEQFTTIGGLRTTQMRLNRQVVTATDVTCEGWRESLGNAGTAFVRLQGAGVFTNSVAETLLQQQAVSGTTSNYEVYFGNGDKMTGAFSISAYERSGKVGDVESFTVTLESGGQVAYVEA